jgi:hypothetical protein
MIFGSSTTFVGLLTVAVRSDFQVSPLKRTSWNSVKLTALNLGDSFTETDEFSRGIAAAKHERRGDAQRIRDLLADEAVAG